MLQFVAAYLSKCRCASAKTFSPLPDYLPYFGKRHSLAVISCYDVHTFITATPLGHNNITDLTQTLYWPSDTLPLLLINLSHQTGGFIYFFIYFAGRMN